MRRGRSGTIQLSDPGHSGYEVTASNSRCGGWNRSKDGSESKRAFFSLPSASHAWEVGSLGEMVLVIIPQRPPDRCCRETVHRMGYSGQVFKSLSTTKK